MVSWVTAPASPPMAPPKPDTLPTARFGKTSAGSVMLPHSECPNIMPISRPSAAAGLCTRVTSRQQMGIRQESTSMVVLRARLSVQPRAISQRGIAPLAMLPSASAA